MADLCCCAKLAVVQTDIELGVRGQTVFPLARLFSHCGKRAGASQLAFPTNHFLHTLSGRCKYTFQCQYNREG